MRKFNITKEVKVTIRKDHRCEFAAAVMLPARIRARRSTVATERYVVSETADNLPLTAVQESNEMDIEEMPINNLAVNRNDVINFSSVPNRNAADNLAIFNAIPSLSQNPIEFFNYQRRMAAGRQSNRIVHPPSRAAQIIDSSPHVSRAIDQLPQAARIDQYLQLLPRMFAVRPQATQNTPRLPNMDPILSPIVCHYWHKNSIHCSKRLHFICHSRH